MIKENGTHKALWEYYKVATEESKNVGTQKIRVFTLSAMCIASFLTFMGILMTQIDKIILSFNLIIICVIIGIMLFLFLVLFVIYYLYLRKLNHNIIIIIIEIEKLQRDILFGEKMNLDNLREKFEKIYPFLNFFKH